MQTVQTLYCGELTSFS